VSSLISSATGRIDQAEASANGRSADISPDRAGRNSGLVEKAAPARANGVIKGKYFPHNMQRKSQAMNPAGSDESS
jgi:hypothetical protein